MPLVVQEPTSRALGELAAADSQITAWWGSPIECASAIARKGRAEPRGEKRAADGLRLLAELAEGWIEVPPTEQLRSTALRLVRTHPLRAADALQLAAAVTASEGRPETLDVVSLDERLAAVARREGFDVLGL